MACQGVELLDTGLDVVPQHGLALGDGVEVDVLDDRLVIGDHRGGVLTTESDTEFRLCLHDRDPQPAFSDDLVLLPPDRTHL